MAAKETIPAKAPKAAKKTKPAKAPKAAKVPAARYGIAEWYGIEIGSLTPEQRRHFGEIALKQARKEGVQAPPCPFLSHLGTQALCNKPGGLCSLRPYERGDALDRTISIKKKKKGNTQETEINLYVGKPKVDSQPSTVCPFRFLQETEIFKWAGEIMLNVQDVLVVKETPFLRKLDSSDVMDSTPTEPLGDTETTPEEDEDKRRAGRIDWLLVDPRSQAEEKLKWCALETQGVYFSGARMEYEFAAYAQSGDHLLYPVDNRRPDYRSNGPKRLAPQLSVKVPVLRSWGNKVAVVVDRYFFNQMAKLEASHGKNTTDLNDKRESAEVIWFVVEYDQNLKLQRHSLHYSDLKKSINALNATEPIESAAFRDGLKELIQDINRRGNKVYPLNFTVG